MEAAIALAVPLGAGCDVMELEFSGFSAIDLRFFNFFFVLLFECLSYDDDHTVNTYMHRLCHRRETSLNCKEIRLINTHSPATDLMHNMVNCRF